MAYGIVHQFPGGTQEQYEASIAAVHPSDGSLPEGQTFHAAGPSEGGWTIVAIHESQEGWERFRDTTLLPRMQAGIPGGFTTPPQETAFAVYKVSTSAETNKAVFRRLMDEGFNQGKLEVINEVVSPDWVNYDPSLPEELHGRDGARKLVSMWKAGFPDFEITIDEMIADGDKIAFRFTFTGVHRGEFLGVPPTGKNLRATGTGIARFVDGKDVEHHVNFDALGVLQQLGIIPVPEPATV